MQGRQPRRSHQQWHVLIEKFKQSNLTQHQFCEIEGLSLATFRKWLYKQKAAKPGAVDPTPADNEQAHSNPTSGFNPVTISPLPQVSTGACLELPGDVRLHTSGIPPVEYVKTLVEALGHEH